MTGSTETLMGNLIESLIPTITVDRFYTSTYDQDSGDSDKWPYEYISPFSRIYWLCTSGGDCHRVLPNAPSIM